MAHLADGQGPAASEAAGPCGLPPHPRRSGSSLWVERCKNRILARARSDRHQTAKEPRPTAPKKPRFCPRQVRPPSRSPNTRCQRPQKTALLAAPDQTAKDPRSKTQKPRFRGRPPGCRHQSAMFMIWRSDLSLKKRHGEDRPTPGSGGQTCPSKPIRHGRDARDTHGRGRPCYWGRAARMLSATCWASKREPSSVKWTLRGRWMVASRGRAKA